MTWRATTSALTASFLFVLFACGGDPGTEAEPTDGTGAKSQTNRQPRENLRQGGTFTFPLDQLPANFNYNQIDGTLQMNFWVVSAMMPSPFTVDEDGNSIWNPNIFASEPTVVTEPVQVVTAQINSKAAWYDGTPITWEDFYHQWKSNNGKDKRFLISSSNGYDRIANVEKGKDDREVIITFDGKYADWQTIFYLLYPASTNKDPVVFNSGWKDAPITTAGPFKLASVNKTTQTITLVRNEKWWGQPAMLDTIVYRVIEPDAQIAAAANGEIDAMDIGPDANKYSQAMGLTNAEVRRSNGPNFRHVTVNGTSSILKDLNVRQAVAMAIDRGAIAKALLTPLGLDAKPLNNHLYMAHHGNYRDNSGMVGRFDQARAAAMLDSAGWKMDGDVRKKDGKPLEIGILVPTGVASARQESEIIQNNLAGVGVKIRVDAVPGREFFDKYITPGQFDLVLFAWMGTAHPLSSSKSLYMSPTKNPDGTLNVQQNYARIGSKLIDSLFIAANAEFDHAKAADLGNRIDSLLWDEVHSLPLYQRPVLFLTKKNLANFGAFGFAIPWVYENIGWMK